MMVQNGASFSEEFNYSKTKVTFYYNSYHDAVSIESTGRITLDKEEFELFLFDLQRFHTRAKMLIDK